LILLTVGTQLPFDRLVKMLDDIAPDLPCKVKAQIGKSEYKPKNVEWMVNIDPVDFDSLFNAATVIVAHAGIGTVLTAKRLSKPIILVARRADLGEHRNDHQLATVSQLKDRPGIYVASDENELRALLQSELTGPTDLPERADIRNSLINNLRQFIDSAL
jgi:UDP-N-acetylglucosamine transferase subunit ALG13